MLDYLERERGIKREILLEAVSNALLSASKKSVERLARSAHRYQSEDRRDPRARQVARGREGDESGRTKFRWRRRAKSSRTRRSASDVEVEVTPKNFGRIAAQTAKQAMMQRIRQVEKEMIYEEFKDRAGEIVSGTVRRFDRSDVILDLGKFEAIMPQRERVVVEDYNVGRSAARLRRRGGKRHSRPGNHRFAQPSEFRPAPLRTRSQRDRRRHGRDSRHRARSRLSDQDRGLRARTKKSIRSALASACAVRG